MHNRLLPLTPPSTTRTRLQPRRTVKRNALPSVPWMQFGLVTLLLYWVIRLGA